MKTTQSHIKIQPTHLKRQAVVYIRQSSPQQVQQNLESQKRQYQLVERAQAWGWNDAQCVVIDEDLGISGAHSANRPGYQQLVSMLALKQVGIVLGLEVSRLARNSLDWYQLLELAATFDVLIADEDGLYDPGEFNDRLLLGLKGTISEVELYQIRARMVRGRMNKVQRGEYKLPLPVGLEWDAVTESIRLSTDASVRHAIEMVFHLFEQCHSIRGVLHYLYQHDMQLPSQRVRRGVGREIYWRQASYDGIHLLLTNPTYAGVYCYGKTYRTVDPVSQKTNIVKRAREDWDVFLPDHHPGYLTLAQFEENQRILANNRNDYERPTQSQGAARQGATLLQGIVYCRHCAKRMRVRYSRGQAYYVCDASHRRFGQPICQHASAKRVDALVEELFLTLVNAETLECSLDYEQKLKQEELLVQRQWEEKLQRLDYQADLARRRYEMVDPANRLVAETLESDWNHKLLELEAAKRDYQAQKPKDGQRKATLQQMRNVILHLRDHWFSGDIAQQEKKELIRCLVEQVFLAKGERFIKAQICWYGGSCSELDVPKYLFSSPYLYHRISELAQEHPDASIASILNSEGVQTVRDRPWSARRVMDFRRSNQIPSGFTSNAQLRTPEHGYITTAEAARQLEVHQGTIQKWYKLGVLEGKHAGGQSQLWIRWDQDVMERLNGGAQPDPRMVAIRALCHSEGKSPDEVLAWAREHDHTIYRLRRNRSMRFYILPGEKSTQAADRSGSESERISARLS